MTLVTYEPFTLKLDGLYARCGMCGAQYRVQSSEPTLTLRRCRNGTRKIIRYERGPKYPRNLVTRVCGECMSGKGESVTPPPSGHSDPRCLLRQNILESYE